jgi:hypothetical protein
VSDDLAFRILSRAPSVRVRRGGDPRELSSAAQREVGTRGRIASFARQFDRERRDPLTADIVGWDANLAMNSPWPWCFRCKSVVRAYGVENRDKMVVTVWARCHGTKAELEVEKPSKDIDRADPNWLRNRMRHLVFFAS